MAHVTFIHGIGNKAAPEQLLRDWRGALADHGLDLAARGVSSSVVYWADLLYASPVAEALYESATRLESAAELESAEQLEAAGVPDIGLRWVVEAQGAEAELIRGVAEAIGFEELSADGPVATEAPRTGEAGPAMAPEGLGFERVPLPPWVKRRLMKILLRDVHHYLFDTAFSPRPGETHRIRQTIRRRVVEALTDASAREGPHVVVSHSMGTVIIYDCLKRVGDCPAIDGLMTIGSPLGLDDVQDQLRPEWSRDDGFPAGRLRSGWVNVFDRFDPVAAFDTGLANDFRRDGVPVIEDLHEPNWGRWRHSIDKYFAGEQLRDRLRGLLEARP